MNYAATLFGALGRQIDLNNGLAGYAVSSEGVPHAHLLLFAAWLTLAEVNESGLVGLFWNATGMIVPEAIEGLALAGLTQSAGILEEAANGLAPEYPIDVDERRDVLISGAGSSDVLIDEMFKAGEEPFTVLRRAVTTRTLDRLSLKLLDLAETENGGFAEAAEQYIERSQRNHA